jgi:5'-nucleotidase
MSKLALIDLDGTMADYDGAITRGLLSLSAGAELETPLQGMGFTREQNPLWLQERERLVRSMPGFYRDLKPLLSGFYVVGVLQRAGYALHVATKAPRHNTAIASKEKIEWCEEYLPNIPVTISGDKSILRGDILFDDWPGYIGPWLEANPNSIVLMPDRQWNANYQADRCYRITESTTSEDILDVIHQHENKLNVLS